MSAAFPRWSNTAVRAALLSGVAGAVGAPMLLMAWMRTPWTTNEGNPVTQPVKFDHRHHVQDDGIDCRYCHTTVETSARAGIPPSTVCMSCHGQIWKASPLLSLVRDSAFSGKPIAWRRVNALPDFVYFDHSIHVSKGVGCSTCHGRVDEMPQVAKGAPLTMQWCLDCHRSPEQNLRPHEAITQMDWRPSNDPMVGAELARVNKVHPGQHCSACHR